MQENVCKRRQIINRKTLIVSVDFGKFKHWGYCRCPDGTEVAPFEFSNNGAGFRKFWNRIYWMMKKHYLEEMVVGFESTGPYGEPLMHFLRKKGVRLVQVNPSHTKKLKQVYDNSPNKTDQKDPKVIADLLELGRFLSVVIPEGRAADLRRLAHARERGLQRRKCLYNQLHDLIFLIFPEFVEVMKNLHTRSAQHVLKHYTTPDAILELGCDELTVLLKKTSRGRLGRRHAEDLFQAASGSVGIREAQVSMVIELRQILSLIAVCDSFIADIEQKLSSCLREVPYSRYILSIKGIGVITVAGLIGEVGDFSKFRTISELMKYAGLNLYEISSGKHRGKRRIAKKGRALMRKLLYFAAINVIRKGHILHKQYHNYLKRGMPKLKALVAISRKLLSIIFALVRNHTTYDANYSNPALHKQAA